MRMTKRGTWNALRDAAIGALVVALMVGCFGVTGGASGFGTHAVVGGAIGLALTESPALAFLIGLASHALLDVMPHHDPDPDDGPDIALFSGFTFATLFTAAEVYRRSGYDPRVLWGAIGGALPDVEHLLFYRACDGYELCPAKIFPTHDGTLPHLGGAPVLVGYPLEIAACLLAIRIAF
jgi:hypothetical protein